MKKKPLNIATITAIGALSLGAASLSMNAFAAKDDINEAPIVTQFKKLDTDNDGTLTRAEAAKDKLFTKAHFKKADVDNDGTIDQTEYSDYKSSAQSKEVKRVASDSVITTKVKADLVKEEGFKGLQVKVETHNGVVLLSGFVDTKEQIARAEEIAKTVEGVKSVKNGLAVKG